MCDYSLAHVPNRLAVKGEELVIHRFPTQTLGLAPISRSLKHFLFPSTVPAVCVPPGAQLFLWDMPEQLQRLLNVNEIEVVTFVQKSAEAFIYRDAVRFANGREVLLQHLRRGQRVSVLSLCEVEIDDSRKLNRAKRPLHKTVLFEESPDCSEARRKIWSSRSTGHDLPVRRADRVPVS